MADLGQVAQSIPKHWCVPDSANLQAVLEQLRKEVSPGHLLYERDGEIIARSLWNDDVLFLSKDSLGNPEYWLVHLVWGPCHDHTYPEAKLIEFPEYLEDEYARMGWTDEDFDD